MRSITVVTVLSVALIGGQAAAAETNRLPPKSATAAPELPLGGSGAKAAQAREPGATSAKKRKKKRKRRKAAPSYAYLGGKASFSNALVYLQTVNGGRWVDLWQTTSGPSGYYGPLRVLAGYSYRFYVSTEVNTPTYFPWFGTLNCGQTWADYSAWVTAARNVTYTLNTTLQPVGQIRC